MSKAGDLTKKQSLTIAGGFLAFGIVVVVIYAFVWFQRDIPETHADVVDHFKYGSIGAEGRSGLPYWIWVVLPEIFPEYLPGDQPGEGLERFGFVFESSGGFDRGDGVRRPIGTSYRESPIPKTGLNCAVCHTGTIRETPIAPEQIVLGMGAHQFDLQSYVQFLTNAGADERFNAGVIIPAIEKVNPSFSWLDNLLYRFRVIPETRDGLIKQAADFEYEKSRPRVGHGRVDTFNPYKVLLGININENDDGTISVSDLPTIYNQGAREGMWLHWDGNNDSLDERNISAAIGGGASFESLDHEGIQRVAEWIFSLPPPAFPADKIDQSRVASGKAVYDTHCAVCHAFDGEKTGLVTDISEIGTDTERLDSFTPAIAAAVNTIGAGEPWAFSHFRETNGYANMPLDGVWLRAPYLHNGSVPTLTDLLKPPSERPKFFRRGYNVYDYDNVGFVSEAFVSSSVGSDFDTSLRSNGNEGHTYGTNLSDEEKKDLIEYMKTE